MRRQGRGVTSLDSDFISSGKREAEALGDWNQTPTHRGVFYLSFFVKGVGPEHRRRTDQKESGERTPSYIDFLDCVLLTFD